MPLQSRFLSQLDLHSEKLFKKRGGQIGKRLESILAPMAHDDVDLGRECVIKALSTSVSMWQQMKPSIEETTVGIYIFKQSNASDEPDNIEIVLEDQVVLEELDNVALAAVMLFGLMYVLNLNYPPELKYTFSEVLQKVVMELEGSTLAKKAQVLKNFISELSSFGVNH